MLAGLYSVCNVKFFAGLFAISGNQLVVASGTRLDYEEEPVYTIVVMTTDNGTPQLNYEVGQ